METQLAGYYAANASPCKRVEDVATGWAEPAAGKFYKDRVEDGCARCRRFNSVWLIVIFPEFFDRKFTPKMLFCFSFFIIEANIARCIRCAPLKHTSTILFLVGRVV